MPEQEGPATDLAGALDRCTDVDEVARCVLTHAVAHADVRRAGLALTEGAGRRLWFASSDSLDATALEWCHIDAYDDVPLTTVVRTGRVVHGTLDDLEASYAGLVARQRAEGTGAIVAVPLPGVGSPIGGLVLFLRDPAAAADHRHWKEAALLAADALLRVRAAAAAHPDTTTPPDPALAEGGHEAVTRLDADPRAAGEARRFVRQQLEAWGVGDDDVIDDAELCVTELVNNAIMHAARPALVRVRHDAGVIGVEVRDVGSNAPQVPLPATPDDDPMRVFGRGLTLVDALAERWGLERAATGTTAWFVLASTAAG